MLKKLFKPKYRQDASKSNLENLSQEFAFYLGDQLRWRWDERLEMVVTDFDQGIQDTVINILETYFVDYWNLACAEEIPADMLRVIMKFDGLAPDQHIFSSDSSKSTFFFCAWWPWSDKKTVSIRISPFMERMTSEEKQRWIGKVRSWFNCPVD